MRIGYLYTLTNTINNKVYVGKTYSNIHTRLREHVSESKSERSKSRKLYKAINKYGIDSFVLELIASLEEGLLEIAEQDLISELDSFKLGYNSTKGGDGRRYLKVSDVEIIEEYSKYNNQQKVADILKISVDSVNACLKTNNIAIPKYIAKGVGIRFPEVDINFNSAADAARFLIDCDIAPDSDIRGIAGSLVRVAKGKRKYYKGIKVEYWELV